MPSAEPPGGPGDPSFRVLGEVERHRGWAISLRTLTVADPDGTTFERDVVRHPGAVAVVPVTAAGRVVLVRQYRPAVDRWLLEVPAGTCDVDGEPVTTTAARELAEETGRAADSLELLATVAVTPGFCDEWAHLFLATGLREVATDRQGVEEAWMTTVEVPLEGFDALVDDGAIVDAQTVLAVALARRRLAAGA